MKILVTGGAGFIGCCLVDKLIKLGHDVVVIDNLSTGCIENVNPKATFYKIDIRDAAIAEIFEAEGPEIVAHLASQINVDYSLLYPMEDATTNIIGTLNVLENCRKYRVRKIIFSSSAAVYGIPCYLPIDENHPLEPISNYGISKKCAESYCKSYALLHNVKFTILRFSNVYGLRQSIKGEGGVVTAFLRSLQNKEKCFIYGNGENTRDFIFLQDVVDAIISAISLGDNDIFNISTGISISINELYKTMCQSMNIFYEAVKLDAKEGDITHSLLDNSHAYHFLDWRPKYSLKEGLQEIISNCKEKVII